jgi:integrase
MVIRIDQGKGRKDRYVMLSPKLLQVLSDYWHAVRPKGCLFPGDIPGQPITRAQSNWLVRRRTPVRGFPNQ